VVAEAHVLYAASADAVEHVHHALALVEAGEEAWGEEVAGEHDDGVGDVMMSYHRVELWQVLELVHIIDKDDSKPATRKGCLIAHRNDILLVADSLGGPLHGVGMNVLPRSGRNVGLF